MESPSNDSTFDFDSIPSTPCSFASAWSSLDNNKEFFLDEQQHLSESGALHDDDEPEGSDQQPQCQDEGLLGQQQQNDRHIAITTTMSDSDALQIGRTCVYTTRGGHTEAIMVANDSYSRAYQQQGQQGCCFVREEMTNMSNGSCRRSCGPPGVESQSMTHQLDIRQQHEQQQQTCSCAPAMTPLSSILCPQLQVQGFHMSGYKGQSDDYGLVLGEQEQLEQEGQQGSLDPQGQQWYTGEGQVNAVSADPPRAECTTRRRERLRVKSVVVLASNSMGRDISPNHVTMGRITTPYPCVCGTGLHCSLRGEPVSRNSRTNASNEDINSNNSNTSGSSSNTSSNTNSNSKGVDCPCANHLNDSLGGWILPSHSPTNSSNSNNSKNNIGYPMGEDESDDQRNATTPSISTVSSSPPVSFASFFSSLSLPPSSSSSSSAPSSSSSSPSTPLPTLSPSASASTLVAWNKGHAPSPPLTAASPHAHQPLFLNEEIETGTPSSSASFTSCLALASQAASPTSPKPTSFLPIAQLAFAERPSVHTLSNPNSQHYRSVQHCPSKQQDRISDSIILSSRSPTGIEMKPFDIPPRRSSISFQTTTPSSPAATTCFGSTNDSPAISHSQRPYFITRQDSTDKSLYPRRHLSLDIHRSSSPINTAGGRSSSYNGATTTNSNSSSPVQMRRAGSHSAYGSKGKCLAWSRPRLTFDRLPHEIKLQIFRYLSTFNLIRVTRVSRSWRALALDGSLWRVIDTTRYYRTIEDQQLLGLGRAAAGFLRYANFRGCTQLSSNTIRNIAEQCPNIRRLDLSGCRSISSKAFADVCMNLSHLVFLNTSGLDTVNNYTLQAIGVYCRSLQVLNIAHCRHISGSGVAKLARSCRELRDLNMAGCQGLDERHMMTIGMHLGKLRELCLNGCHSLTDRGILALLTGLASAARTSLDQKRSERFARALRGLGEGSGGNSGSLSMEARIRQYYRRRLEAQRQGSQDMAAVVDDDEGLMVDDEDESDFELEPVPWDPESESDDLENGFAGMMDLEGTSDSDQETSTKTTANGLQAPALLPVAGSTSTSTNNQSHNNNNISSNTATTNNDSNNNSGSFTRLTYLGLSNCRLLTNESLFAIGDQCGKTLERLELASCERLNDDGLIFLARHCERLRFIDLEDVRLLTDLTLREFALRLSRLERICLSNCENVTDQGVMQLFKGALVQQLNPPQPNGAANANLQPTVHRVGGSKQLVHIELDNCLLITDRLLLEFASAVEERRVQALERWRNMEDEQNKRRAAREMRRKRYLSRLERRKGKAKQTDPVEDASPGPSSFLENSEIMGDGGGSFERDISQDLSGVHMTEEMLVFESRRNSWAGPSAAGTTTKELGGGEGSATTSVGVGMSSSSVVGSWPFLHSASASSSSLHLPPVQASTSLSKIAIKKPRPCCVSHSSSCSLLITTGSGNCLSSSLSSSPGTIHSSPLSRSLSQQQQQEGASPTSSTGSNGGVSTTCTCPCVLTSALSEATKVNQELHKNPHIRASLRALRQMPLPPLAWSWTSYALQRRYKMLKQRIQQRQIYYCQQVAYFQQLYQHHQRKQQQQMLDDELMFGNDSGLGLHQYDQDCTPSFNLAKQGLPPSILHRHPWMNQRRAIIQVFDCRNITLDGVEAALKKVQTRDFAIKSYYSWANPAIADPMGQQQQQQQQQRLTLGALISAFGGGNRQNSNNNNSNTNPLQSQSSGDTPFDYLDFAFDYNYSFPHDEEVDEAAAEEQETTNGSSGLGSVVAIYGTTTTPTAAADTTIASQHGLIHHASQASLQQHLQQSSQMNHGNTAQQAQSGGRSQRSRRHGNYPRNPPCPIL